MLTPTARERYLRHILLKEIGAQGQQKLLDARVLIVGAGGLGAPLIQYLAAAGVGTLGIADDDEVELANLQRQVVFSTADLGAPKIAAAGRAVGRLNPEVRVVEHPRLTEANAAGVVADYDVVAEGVDNFEGRFALNRACIARRRPLVSAAIGRFEGQVSTFKPYAGEDLPCYRCLVPEAPPRAAQVNCLEEGVLGPVAGVLGSIAALEVVKEILGLGESLAGRLLVYNALKSDMRTLTLRADPGCPECRHLRKGTRGAA
jgi:adenylyltransferase/sulfurtransferase